VTALLIIAAQFFRSDPTNGMAKLWIFGVPAIMTYRYVKQPVRFSLCLAALLLTGCLAYVGPHGRVLQRERNFFGVLRVTEDEHRLFHQLVHGNTLHGRQSLDPARQTEPLCYFHPTGPIGQVFDMVHGRASLSPTNIAVIGLGAGSLACYARPTEGWTFYEINPAVEQIARDPNCFTFMSRSNAKSLRVVLGDARLQLKNAPDHAYNLIVGDAFSSDSIPVHLLTREAFRLYDAKLAPGGLLAFHISNRRLNLAPIVASLASDGGFVALDQQDTAPGPSGKENSEWTVMARRSEDLQPLLASRRWQVLTPSSTARVWTDDFSNILGVLKWR
jgi:hypothetical protein